MARAFALSLRQLGDPAILRVLVWSLAITLALFAALGAAGWEGLRLLGACARIAGASVCGGDGGVAAGGGLILALLAAWLLFPAVAIGVVGLSPTRWSRRSSGVTTQMRRRGRGPPR